MLSWGDAANTWPIYWRDNATDAPINKATYPKTNNYGWPKPDGDYQGLPDFVSAWDIFNASGQDKSGVTPDDGHLNSLCYVPYLSTGDSVSLESLQFIANFCIIANQQTYNGIAVVATAGGTRTMAWPFGTVVKAWRATVEAEKNGPLPAWLMPSSYWDTILTNTRVFLSNGPTRRPAAQRYFTSSLELASKNYGRGSSSPSKHWSPLFSVEPITRLSLNGARKTQLVG